MQRAILCRDVGAGSRCVQRAGRCRGLGAGIRAVQGSVPCRSSARAGGYAVIAVPCRERVLLRSDADAQTAANPLRAPVRPAACGGCCKAP